MKKYTHPLTKDLTPENWKDKIDLATLSLEDLANICGDLNQMEKFAKKLSGYLKEILKAKLPEDEFETAFWQLVRADREREGGLDIDRIREEMGDEWVEEHRKEPTEYTELRFARKPEE